MQPDGITPRSVVHTSCSWVVLKVSFDIDIIYEHVVGLGRTSPVRRLLVLVAPKKRHDRT